MNSVENVKLFIFLSCDEVFGKNMMSIVASNKRRHCKQILKKLTDEPIRVRFL